MRVGIFTESYEPIINGVSTSVRTLIAQLEQAGHQVFVFTSRMPGYQDDRAGVFRFPSMKALVEPNYRLPLPFSPHIMAAIPGLHLDIVHSQSPFLLGLVARQVARRAHIPLVSTNHTLYTEYAHYFPLLPKWATREALISLMRWYYNQCDHVLAPSQMTRQRLIDGYGVRTPVTVTPTGIPASPYLLKATRADTLTELGLPQDARILLYVGRLAPEKNLEMLLDAFGEISAAEPRAYLVLAGSGKSERSLKAMVRARNWEKRVVFTGFLGRTRLDPLYAASELFLFPSKTETQGLAVGEALAAGVPSIVVGEGGAPEAVHEAEDGFIIPDDPHQMASLALQLLHDPVLCRQMSEAARRYAEERTPEKVAARILGVYDSLIADVPDRQKIRREKEKV